MPVNYGQVNENSTCVFHVTPTMADGTEVAPTSATYRIDDKVSTNSIVTTTNLSVANPLVITITPAQNSMIDSDRACEVKTVTVIMNFADGSRRTVSFEYTLRNLRFIT